METQAIANWAKQDVARDFNIPLEAITIHHAEKMGRELWSVCLSWQGINAQYLGESGSVLVTRERGKLARVTIGKCDCDKSRTL